MEWLFLCLAGGCLVALYWAFRHHKRAPSKTGPGDATLPSEASMHGLIQRANTLREAYARVLEKKGSGIIRPESHLPASKEEIKAALLLCALATVSKANRQPDTATLHHYQVSYGFLAHFVADETLEKRTQEGKAVSKRDGAARPEITDAAMPRQVDSLSPVEFLNLCEEFAQRFDALTDRERGRAESLRIRAALLGA
jgi:hypothetical protein